jgi:hypothetical protein
LPSTDSDNGDAEICFAEGAVFHVAEYTPRREREIEILSGAVQ